MPALLSPHEMPVIDGLNIPEDFYIVAKEPAILAGMAYPYMRTPWKNMYDIGIMNVVCLCESSPGYPHYPLRAIYSAKLEDLHHGTQPRDPVAQEKLVRDAVDVIITQISSGEGVVVHCVGGIGRTGTVIGCTLKAMGYPANTIISYLDRLNRIRGIMGWPESTWQAEMIKKF